MAVYDHWMRLNVGDYLGDTLHLTTLQHGMYFLLLMHYFKRRELPDDPRGLAQIARMRVDKWNRVSAPVMALFSRQDDQWRHKRLDAEIEAALMKSRVSITEPVMESAELGPKNEPDKSTFPYQKTAKNGGSSTRARTPPRARDSLELELERKRGAPAGAPGAPAGAPPPKGFQSRPKGDAVRGAAACRAIARENANARSERIQRGDGADRTDPRLVTRTLRVVS